MTVLPAFYSYIQSTWLAPILNGWQKDGQSFIEDKLPKLLLHVILAFVLIRLLALIASRIVYIAEQHAADAIRISQVKALASVIRATGIGVIAGLCALSILGNLGINLAPLLASAGVAGVAVGLAAQTIVKDMLNGMLILVEDQFGVGDVVSVAGVTGTVEAMSLRKTTIRDGAGALYVIPNSQITIVANQSRDFSVATINVSVDYSANPDKVIPLLKNIAMSVRNDPDYSHLFLEAPQVLGVDAFKGSEVIYPVILKTKANQQWAPMRETRRRIRLALEKEDLLPGDPYRVFNRAIDAVTGKPKANSGVETKSDPTASPAKETNPFTGEG